MLDTCDVCMAFAMAFLPPQGKREGLDRSGGVRAQKIQVISWRGYGSSPSQQSTKRYHSSTNVNPSGFGSVYEDDIPQMNNYVNKGNVLFRAYTRGVFTKKLEIARISGHAPTWS